MQEVTKNTTKSETNAHTAMETLKEEANIFVYLFSQQMCSKHRACSVYWIDTGLDAES